MTSQEFEFLKAFVNSIISQFKVSEAETHVGIIEYSDTATVKISFKDKNDLVSVRRAIDRVTPSRGRNAVVNEALKLAREELFSPIGGGRPGVTKVLMILTTAGKISQPIDDAAFHLRQAGVGIYVFGIGSNVDMTSLRNITGGLDRVYVVPTVRDLPFLILNVTRAIGDTGKGN